MNTFHQFLTEKLYKNQLNPKFWSNILQFDDNVRQKLIKICKDFIIELELGDLIEDIILTGSIANYNYTRFSDLDVHMMLNFKKINKDVDLVKSNLDGKRFIWNLKHNIMIRGHEVELYFQDINEKHIASGMFSLMNDKWIKKPIYDPPTVDIEYVKLKVNHYVKEIDNLQKKLLEATSINYKDFHNRAIKLREKILKMRKDSLNSQGEYGIGNLTFKQLRNLGYIDKVIEISNQSYDKIYSEQ